MSLNRQESKIRALGRIEGFKEDISSIADSLGSITLWRPGRRLKKQCEEALQILGDYETHFDRCLVVTLIGPCGSGKSTMLNALSGIDNLSAAGHERPTTKNLVILCRNEDDADDIVRHIGRDMLEICPDKKADSLENVILIDTPDTDSMEFKNHVPVVRKAIDMSDVLICLFDSENPKRKDYVDFVAPYVHRFTGESLVCVMSKCDRRDEKELVDVIVPEFLEYIEKAWKQSVEELLCVSSRSHLKNPGWAEKAGPRHDFDQFDELKKKVFGIFNQAGYAIERRVENTKSIKDYMICEIKKHAASDQEMLEAAAADMAEVEKEAVNESLSALKQDDSRQLMGVNVLLYQKMAQLWLGPVGWLIAIWARIMIFGTGMLSMFRFGNPVRQAVGVASSLWNFKEAKAAVGESENSERIENALRDYRRVLIQKWPDIAEYLVKARFETSVRETKNVIADNRSLGKELDTLWNRSLDDSIERASKRMSNLFLQLIFNLPVISILCYVGWITGTKFFARQYLTADFFLHAFLTVTIVLFLSFFLFQGLVRIFAGPDRIAEYAFNLVREKAEHIHPLLINPVEKQVHEVLDMVSSSSAITDHPDMSKNLALQNFNHEQ
ncbi:50S ribosome-binding GTPase [Desulfobacterales bacterium HSG16]|nr:50S ribosome-binding GTPase [Desulfobacterales bacterium HSG16]